MEFFMKFVFLCLMLSEIHGFYIKQDNSDSSIENNEQITENFNFKNIISSWSNFKRKLQHSRISGLNENLNNDQIDFSDEKFNELEVLRMIPSVIDELRAKNLSPDDELILSEIYGTLWQIICQEAERSNDEETNPLLKALLQSFFTTNDITNDIDGNTVHQVQQQNKKPKSNLAHKLLLNINKDDHPSQRVLNTAAILIRQMNTRDAEKVKNNPIEQKQKHLAKKPKLHSKPRTATLNLKLTNIPINEISRSKRNIQFRVNSVDMPATKIDALLKIFRDENGIDSNENDDDDDDDEDDEYNDENSANNRNDLLINSNNNKDYMYDDLYEDDEEAVSTKSQDPDYGSFQDLILLATKHRLRREEEENQMINSMR